MAKSFIYPIVYCKTLNIRTMFAITLYDIIRLVIAFLSWNTITGPVTTKTYKLACAPIEDSDQAAHPRSLIRVFDGRSMGSQGYNVSSDGELRL